MKKLASLILTSLLSCFYCYSQQKEIEWDFNNGIKPDERHTINANQQVLFKIKNLNTFLYDIEISKKDEVFFHQDGFSFITNLISQLKVSNIVSSVKSLGAGEGHESWLEAAAKRDTVNSLKNLGANLDNYASELDTYIEKFNRREKLFCIDDFDEKFISRYTTEYALDFTKATLPQLENDQKKITEIIDIIVKVINDINKYNLTKQQKLKEKVDEISDKIKGNKIGILIDAAVGRQKVIDIKKFIFTSKLYNLSGDETLFSIKITPKTKLTSECKGNHSDQLDFKIAVIKKWRITLSSGFFYSKLTNDKYILKDFTTYDAAKGYDTVNNKQAVLEKKDKFSIGLALLAHYTYKISKNHEFGIHIGVGSPVQSDFKINYLTGFSYFYGYDQRIGINIGLAGGQITQLSNSVDLSRKYDPKYTAAIQTTNKFVFDRLQFSLTFNINDVFKKE